MLGRIVKRLAYTAGGRAQEAATDMFRNSARHVRSFVREISRFAGARRAATAVEFALIAGPFLATLIAILEVTAYLFAQQVLQNGASETGRLFMTGQAQNSGITGQGTAAQQQAQQQQLQNDICPMISALFNCSQGSLLVNVQSYADFSSANTSETALTFNAQGISNTWTLSPGTPGQVMVVQLIYAWPIVSGPLGYVLSSLGNGHTEMMGVSAFRVEPY
jgi:Flp pilus assembly protein TadG